MKRRFFCRISGLTVGSLFLPAPLLTHGAAPDEAARIFKALRAHHAGDCPAHHHEDVAELKLPLPPNTCTSRVVRVERVGTQVPNHSALAQHDPASFISTTPIPFTLAEAGFVDLRVYNRWGQKVATLVEEHLAAGSYQVVWEVENLAPGTYQYVLESGSFLQARRMVRAG